MTLAATTAGPILTMPRAPRAFHVMAKPSGATCNLDCDYCFFLSKEMLYPGSRFRMAEDLQELYLRQLLAAHRGVPEVVVAWQGGEPTLMGLDFFRRSVELDRAAQAARPAGAQHAPDERHAAHRRVGRVPGRATTFLVGISIDGPREIHDSYRVDKGGKPTFDRVMRGLDVLRRNKVDYNVLTTIHAANEQRGREVYRFLRDECGARVHAVHPHRRARHARDAGRGQRGLGRRAASCGRCTSLDGSLVTDRTVSPDGYGRFLIDVFEDWVRRDIGTRLRPDVRHRARQLGRRAGRDVRPRRDVRRAARARAQRRPVLVRPLRRAALPAGQHPRAADARHGRARRSSASSARTSATRSPSTAATATSASPATAAAPRTASPTSPYGEPGQHYLCPSVQVVLPPRPPGRWTRCATCCAADRAPSEVMAALRGRGRQARPQRPVHLRQRPQVEGAATART